MVDRYRQLEQVVQDIAALGMDEVRDILIAAMREEGFGVQRVWTGEHWQVTTHHPGPAEQAFQALMYVVSGFLASGPGPDPESASPESSSRER